MNNLLKIEINHPKKSQKKKLNKRYKRKILLQKKRKIRE